LVRPISFSIAGDIIELSGVLLTKLLEMLVVARPGPGAQDP
jgi:hypothetical protein